MKWMTNRPHFHRTANPELHWTGDAIQDGQPSTPTIGPIVGNSSTRSSVLTPRRVSHPQIQRTIFCRERLRTRKDAPGAVRTPDRKPVHSDRHVSDFDDPKEQEDGQAVADP